MERQKMKNLRVALAASVLTMSICLLVIAPARAEVFYPRSPCRIYVDTDFIGLPNQCGSAMRVYSRRTLLPHVRR